MSYPKQQYIPLPQSEVSGLPSPPNVLNYDEALLNAIRMCNLDLCKDILSKDSEALHRKGWNNLTPLHQASLSGQIHIIEFFMRNGANPNARNSFEETPLHYACRRGVVHVVHFMIKNGADVNCIDKKGRNCMHFAALNGNVVMLHYLRDHTNLQFDTPDDTGRNILHVSVEMRQFASVYYLTRHNRVDPSLKDLRGVTPLHIAVEKGMGEIAWRLLESGGCEMLKIKNQNGETPLDLARSGASQNSRNMFKILSSYVNSKGPPRGPIFTWYFLLSFPFVYLAVMFSMSVYLNSYGGHFCVLMSAIFMYYSRFQEHRIPHISRWANPIHLGLFVGGILHCAIAEFGYLHRAIWPCPMTVCFSTILTGLGIYFLVYLIFCDPGVDKTPMFSDSLMRPVSVLDIAEGHVPENQFCPFSELIHGPETKYCRICEKPMLNLDHHCLFLNNCIARRNHRHFIILILLVMMLQVSFVYCSIQYMRLIYDDKSNSGLGDSITPYLIHLYKNKPWIFCLTMLCMVSFIWEATLIYSQFSVIMKGSTTYLTLKNKHNHIRLTKTQMFLNLFTFFIKSRDDCIARRAVTKDAVPLMHA